MVETTFNRHYELPTDKIADEVQAGVGRHFMHHVGVEKGYIYFFLDKSETQVVRFSEDRRRVDLSEGVPEDIDRRIKYVMGTEIRGNDW